MEIHDHVEKGEILHNHDGTFQLSVNMNTSSVPSEDWTSYSCVFQFSGVENNTVTTLNKSTIRTNWGKNKISNDESEKHSALMFLCSQNNKKYHYCLLTGGKVSQGWHNKIQRKKLAPSLSYYTSTQICAISLAPQVKRGSTKYVDNEPEIYIYLATKCLFSNPWADDRNISLYFKFTLLLYIIIILLLLAFFQTCFEICSKYYILAHIYHIHILLPTHTLTYM